MIILDTHIWVWWVHGDDRLTKAQTEIITANEADIIGVSAISCWEVAKLVEYGRLVLPCSLEDGYLYSDLAFRPNCLRAASELKR